MAEDNPHEIPKKSKKKIKYIMIGISAFTFLSVFFMPWSFMSFKDIIVSLMSLLFVNGFLFWSYYILYVWKQRIMEKLERKYSVKIIGNTTGSFNIIGDVSITTKLSINMQILFYFVLGMVGPIALLVGVLLLFR